MSLGEREGMFIFITHQVANNSNEHDVMDLGTIHEKSLGRTRLYVADNFFLPFLFGVVELVQPGEVAISVPMSLVVTLEKVLGDETIGMLDIRIKSIVLFANDERERERLAFRLPIDN